ncbi:MAG TPA: patatin-like phospholipase family protein [Methylomirabilota bacterium]|nr:patatin-like phospholipase family protein [Methylomirabilota bacterium]
MPTLTHSGPRIGLALGGGGARGIAHVHALQALDDLGLRPAAIAGTSIGAIVGAGTAAGLSGGEVREVLVSSFRNQGEVWSRIWQLRPKRFGDIFGNGLVQFDAERVLDVFLPESVPSDFAMLRTPLAIAATDFYGCSEVTLTSGPLRLAIAASIALPIVFKPVVVDGVVMMDGGVTNPLPYDRLPEPVDIVLAVDVVGMPVRADARPVPTAWESIFGASQILMQSITTQKVGKRPPDILARPSVDAFKVLDFLKVAAIIKATAPIRDDIKRELDTAITAFEKGRRPRGGGDRQGGGA